MTKEIRKQLPTTDNVECTRWGSLPSIKTDDGIFWHFLLAAVTNNPLICFRFRVV